MRGVIPKAIRDKVKAKFGGRCAYCGQMPEKLCIDHFHPVAKAHVLKAEGKDVNHIDNLMPACFSCNNYKMSWDIEWFRQELKCQVGRAREHSINFRLAERFGQLQPTPKPIKFYFEKPEAPSEQGKTDGK